MNLSDKAPTADVYADDISSPATTATDNSVHVFTIEADAEPGTFARIANVLNIANTTPRRVNLELKENRVTLSIQVDLAVSAVTARSIQRKLSQLTDVIEVDCETRPPGR
jgi:(p)ppGpp synthase/HD superfamily hydrolase